MNGFRGIHGYSGKIFKYGKGYLVVGDIYLDNRGTTLRRKFERESTGDKGKYLLYHRKMLDMESGWTHKAVSVLRSVCIVLAKPRTAPHVLRSRK